MAKSGALREAVDLLAKAWARKQDTRRWVVSDTNSWTSIFPGFLSDVSLCAKLYPSFRSGDQHWVNRSLTGPYSPGGGVLRSLRDKGAPASTQPLYLELELWVSPRTGGLEDPCPPPPHKLPHQSL